jgi:putative ABC transport system permease protein
MYMNIGERTHEIGILRSQGASARQVFWIFFSESLILGVIGVVIGLGLGLVVTDVFRYFTARIFQPFSPGIDFSFQFPVTTIQHLILGAAAGLITVMIGGLAPSLSATRTTIMGALRPAVRKPGKQRTALKLVLAGLPLTVFGTLMYLWYDMLSAYSIGLFVAAALAPIGMAGVTLLTSGLLRSGGPVIERSLFGFGKTRKIISRNVERNLLRSTICFALIGISLSLVIEMGSAQMGTVSGIESVIHSFSSSDLTLMSEGDVPKSFVENITKIQGVSASTPVQVVNDQTILQNNVTGTPFNSTSTVLAIDTISYPQVMGMTFSSDTPQDVFERLNESNTILLTAPLAESLNVTVGDKVGVRYIDKENRTFEDDVEVKTPMGNQTIHVKYDYTVPVLAWKNYTVVGVAQGAWMDIMSFGNFALSEASYVSYNNLNATFPNGDIHNDTANVFFVKVNSDANITQTKDDLLNQYGREYKLTVTTYQDAIERVRSSIDEIFYILYAVVMFAVANACIGVAAIMVMNVAERRREIGILRSQGMSKGQVVTAIVGEAVFLGMVGLIMGVAVGLMLTRATISYMAVAGFPMPFVIPYESLAMAFGLALFASVVSALYPANRASNENIVEAIRQ